MSDQDPIDYFTHPLAVVETPSIGRGTRVWAFAHILDGAEIGSDCNICDHVLIESDVTVGDRVTVKSGVQLWNGVRLGDDVFVGPNVTFTNDPFPRSRDHSKPIEVTIVEQGASIGGNATILPGVRIGRDSMIGAGSVVVGDVPANAVVVGNPARITGYVGAGSSPPAIGQTSERIGSGPFGKRGVLVTERPMFSDLRGSLTVTEVDELPFTPVRFFTVYGVPSKEIRGEHAHRQCAQLLTCVSGSVRVLWDDGTERGEVMLDSPTRTMLLPPRVWGSQFGFTADAVLTVAASHPYDPDDYIRSYTEFLQFLIDDECDPSSG